MKKKSKIHHTRVSHSYLLVMLFFLGICCFSAQAQVNTVSGKVTSVDGTPLLGVNIIQKGTNNGVVSDFDGNYNLNLKTGSRILVFSYLGFEDKEISVTSKSTINVSLIEDNEQLDEVVVIGYGTVKKRDVLGSVASVKSKELNESIPEDALQGIQGRVAGVQIITNGAPGGGSEILIRGISTLSGGTGPLYVVDGQQVDDIDNLNPSDIESMDVLKDGASAAIYGSKSANGVVIITTKKGKLGKPKIDVSIQSGISFLSNKVPVSNTLQRNKFISLRTGSTDNSGAVQDSLGIRTSLVVDIQEEIKQLGNKNQINVAFSGGSEGAKYYWNSGFLTEEGIIIGSSFKRMNSNLNLDFDISKVVTAGTRMSFSYQFQDGIPEATVFRELSYRQPDVLLIDFDGSYVRERFARSNPIARADLATQNNRQFRGSSFNYINFQIIPGLSFRSTLGFNYRQQKLNEFRPSQTVDATSGRITGSERQRLSYDIQNENYFSYNKEFKGGHSVTGLLGLSVQKWEQENSDLVANEFNNDYIETFNNVAELNLDNTGTYWFRHSLSSVYARATYNYKDKYLLGATFRRDGSSRFGDDKRWGNFPGVSAGWRISGENFMKSVDFISEFKLRASYAITGNERIGNYDNQALYAPGNYYDGTNGFAAFQLGNPNLGWEQTAQQNYGVDLGLFKRRLSISVDGYIKTTTDLLYDRPIPEETGFSSVRANIGSVENKGLEFQISGTPIQTKNFSWFSSFNLAYNENTVLELADEDGFEVDGYYIEEGKSIGNMYGYKNLGVYRYDESNAYTNDGVRLKANFDENDNFVNYTLKGEAYNGTVNKLMFGNRELGGGDIIFEDQNNDFVIDNANDRTIIGNGLSDYSGGFRNSFTYKEFSFTMLFNFNFGNDIYRGYDHTRDKASNSVYTPGPYRIEGAWVNPGDIAKYPSLESSRSQNRSGYESNYVSKADFIKLQNIRIGYNFNKETLDALKIADMLSLSVVVNNLVTFTNYEGYNPELGWQGNPLRPGWDNLRYPNKTEIIFSLNARF
ncbi:TonB-dependent receptor [Formosa sp. PL04]|uniref:SusC/RagA family TonB-linked outer membrane protein n=1 Tax=Formosa sp. PL04 TaxID=3081755 RepID=UPI0029815D59|nr:TonB-dependent receptor [Formosa sp. PL04]MDW5288147.1 TonB-dependent receptor [Formosa sp. PL04]